MTQGVSEPLPDRSTYGPISQKPESISDLGQAATEKPSVKDVFAENMKKETEEVDNVIEMSAVDVSSKPREQDNSPRGEEEITLMDINQIVRNPEQPRQRWSERRRARTWRF